MDSQKSLTYDEAFRASLAFLGGDEMIWALARQLKTTVAADAAVSAEVLHDEIGRLFENRRKQTDGNDQPKSELPAVWADLRPQVTEVRPQVLECDVVRFQNNKEKWVALVGLLNGYPYEIFTGLQDDDEGIILPKSVTSGKIIKQVNPDGTKRYDFQFENKRGYKTTVEGLSEKFNPEYWNYAKLISGVLRYRMPIEHVIKLVSSLQLKDESINTWKNGVERALKKYVPGAVQDDIESV